MLLGSTHALRQGMRAGLRHEIHHRQAVMILCVIGMMAESTSPPSHLEVSKALCRLAHQICGFLWVNLRVMVLSLTVSALVHRAHAIELTILRGAFASARPSSSWATHSAHSCQVAGFRGGPLSKTQVRESKVWRSSGVNFWRFLRDSVEGRVG